MIIKKKTLIKNIITKKTVYKWLHKWLLTFKREVIPILHILQTIEKDGILPIQLHKSNISLITKWEKGSTKGENYGKMM